MNNKRPVDFIDQNHLIDLLQTLIRLPSVNPPGEEEEMASFVANYLRQAGLEVSLVPIAEGRNNVVARLAGTDPKAKKTIFTGHMDVVPVSDLERNKWQVDPFAGVLQDGCIWGRGAADMKGGLAAAMVALVTIIKHQLKPKGDVVLVATVDEEDTMQGAKALVASGLLSDVDQVVVCEPTELSVQHICRGRSWAKVSVYGQSAHASVKGAGHNAIDDAVRLIDQIYAKELPKTKDAVFGVHFWQVNEIEGGIEPAIVADKCEFIVDARLSPGLSCDELWHSLDEVLKDAKANMQDLNCNYQVVDKREPWHTSLSHPMVQTACQVLRDLDLPVVTGGFHGTTDGSVFQKAGMTPLIIGPGSMRHAHQENELVSILDVKQAAQLYLAMMLNLA